jgi:hypothetical protein
VLLFFVRRYMPESVRYLLSKGRVAEAERTVADIEKIALGRALTADEIKAMPNVRPEVGTQVKVTVFELLAPGRAKNTLLLWVVSFGFLWASNGILFMLPTILQQRGIPLTQAITFQLVQALSAVVGYSACGFLIDRYGRRPVLFLYYFVGAFFHLWFAMASGMWLYFAAAAVGWVNPGVYGATGIYVSELHPTHLRHRGRLVLRHRADRFVPGADRRRLHAGLWRRRLCAAHFRAFLSDLGDRAVADRDRDQGSRARTDHRQRRPRHRHTGRRVAQLHSLSCCGRAIG